MGLFGRGKGGGLMNVIRCDEEDYLVWKWRPLGQEINSTTRENSIRYGSSLRVKDGEVAVFLYRQKDGTMQDFIVGPYDDTIKTANFPVLSSIVGMAFGGESPFQAEIYYINIQGRNQLKFAVPYFNMFDPRFPEMSIPVSVRGNITFSLEDYRNFIKLNRMVDFSLDKFREQIKSTLIRFVKSKVTNTIISNKIPLVQAEMYVDQLSQLMEDDMRNRLHEFGVEMKYFDINNIEIDKESENYTKLLALTSEATAKAAQIQVDYNLNSMQTQGNINLETMRTQSEVNLKNLRDMQRINMENAEETMRIQREEGQYAQHLRSQQDNLGAFSAALNADVLKTGMNNLGQMGTMSLGGDGGTMNPAGMMTGMMMGGAIGQQMAGMMGNMNQALNNPNQQNGMMGGGMTNPNMQGTTPPPMPGATPPPLPGTAPTPPSTAYHVSVNGSQAGPYNYQQLQQLVQTGQMTPQTYVWAQGMAGWEMAGNVQELTSLFMQSQPPVPPPLP